MVCITDFSHLFPHDISHHDTITWIEEEQILSKKNAYHSFFIVIKHRNSRMAVLLEFLQKILPDHICWLEEQHILAGSHHFLNGLIRKAKTFFDNFHFMLLKLFAQLMLFSQERADFPFGEDCWQLAT